MTMCNSKVGIYYNHPINIQGIDIANLIFDLKNKHNKEIDVLKIDTEGTEYELINHIIETGAINEVKRIYFEDHERKIAGPGYEKWKEFKENTLVKMKNYKNKFFDWY